MKAYNEMVAYKIAIVVWKVAYKIRFDLASDGSLLYKAMGKVIVGCTCVVTHCIDKDAKSSYKEV